MAGGVHDRELLASTDQLLSEVKDAETGQRGYLLTGSDEYLTPYIRATAVIPSLMDRVTWAAGVHQPLLAEARLLRRQGEEKLTEWDATVTARREKGLDAAMKIVGTDAGKITMDSIRTLGADMINRESALVNQRRVAAQTSAFRSFWLTVAGLTGLLSVTVLLQRSVDRGIQVREQ